MNETKAMHNLLIFGDSYSTFRDYIPKGYAAYYSPDETDRTDVRKVEETWWHRLCSDMSLNLVLNNSWSGEPVEENRKRTQILGINIADTVYAGLVNISNMIQIGLVNISPGALFQIGLINYNPRSYIPWMPLINFNMGREK